jgi:glutathione S-transferase
MPLVLYYGSGSPYAWRVQLALEHKALPYELKVLSFAAGDTRKPEFVALNPRHRVPVLVNDDFVLYESNAIVEYLDEAFPATGAPLFPGDVRTRALVRRLIMEVDGYFDHAIDPLTTQAFSKKPEERDPKAIADGRKAVVDEVVTFTKAMRGEFLAGPLSAADYALYPLVAFLKRCEMKLPDLDADGMPDAGIQGVEESDRAAAVFRQDHTSPLEGCLTRLQWNLRRARSQTMAPFPPNSRSARSTPPRT